MPNLRQWLEQGPFTLALSSGFFSFFAHTGVLLALEDTRLMPSEVSGSSAGALAGGCWASGCSAYHLRQRLQTLKRCDFWDPSLGFGLLRGDRFRSYVEQITPVSRIEQCMIPLKISAFDLYTRSTHVLEEGSLSKGIYASCAVPLLFCPIRMNHGLYLDGGIQDRPGLSGVSENNRTLYHHILPRQNPRSVKLLGLPPIRPNMVTVVIHGLHVIHPFNLQSGQNVLSHAHLAMKGAFCKPIDGQIIHVRQSQC